MSGEGADISTLTEDQQLALQQFTSITDQPHEAAIPLLQRCQWNSQIAIARFFDGEPADPTPESIPDAPPLAARRQENLMNGLARSPSRTRRQDFEPAPR
ncbi:hypothetical protein LTS18_010295, partial [Coniosporium uncinatum]